MAIIGGSVPFVLFFEGLARAQSTQAAFIQKTLVIWVALLAVPFLRERLRWPHAVAIALLLAGQAWLAGNAGHVAFGSGEAMILAATLLWAVEIVYVKRLMDTFDPQLLATARMALGAVLLIAWVLDHRQGQGNCCSMSGLQWRWVLLTGVLLTGYVGTWYAALARAQAVDVTAVLVFGAVITALLGGAAGSVSINVPALLLVAAGCGVIAWTALRAPAARRSEPGVSTRTAAACHPGPLLFARYAYPPNALGLCGADGPRDLLEYGDAHASDAGLAEAARTFEGAWPYLELIAGANGIRDPLDPRVVEAYWVGNELLDNVSPS